LAVRSCFHIHLITKNLANKTAAKAALTQILSIIFFKMESFDARAKMETEAALASLEKDKRSVLLAQSSLFTDSLTLRSTKLLVPCGQAMYPQVYGALGYKPSGGVATPFAGFNSSAATIGHVFPSILHKDAFLIFRALCKLSMKSSTSENGSTIDPLALQNKYTLPLVLLCLTRSSPLFLSLSYSQSLS
jgi:brefeldin A-inhibited guanine nucleotide-exchange protein